MYKPAIVRRSPSSPPSIKTFRFSPQNEFTHRPHWVTFFIFFLRWRGRVNGRKGAEFAGRKYCSSTQSLIWVALFLPCFVQMSPWDGKQECVRAFLFQFCWNRIDLAACYLMFFRCACVWAYCSNRRALGRLLPPPRPSSWWNQSLRLSVCDRFFSLLLFSSCPEWRLLFPRPLLWLVVSEAVRSARVVFWCV